MKHLTLTQLKKWKPGDQNWIIRMKKEFGEKAEWTDVVKILTKEKEWFALNWLVDQRLKKLNKRQVCAFVYRCAEKHLKESSKKNPEVLKMISFAKQYAETGKIDTAAARTLFNKNLNMISSGNWADIWAIESVAVASEDRNEQTPWATWSMIVDRASENKGYYQWQFTQLLEIEKNQEGRT